MRWLALAALLGGSVATSSARIDVLARSGVTASDGTTIAFFERPAVAANGRVVVRGVTGAVLLRTASGGYRVVARTGDALPAPLAGTFNQFFDPIAGASGAIVFRATLNATAADEGVFLDRGTGTLDTITLGGGSAGERSRVRDRAEVNAQGDVVWADAGGTVRVWRAASGSATAVVEPDDPVPGGGSFRTGRHPTINDAGEIALQGRAGDTPGVFRWSAGAGLELVALEDDRTITRIGRANPINAAGQVAFLTDDAVLRWSPGDLAPTVLAHVNDRVGRRRLTSVEPEYLALTDDGTVAFEGRVAKERSILRANTDGIVPLLAPVEGTAEQFASRLGTDGTGVWVRFGTIERFSAAGVTTVLGAVDATPLGTGVTAGAPHPVDGGDVVFVAAQAALYELAGGALTRLVGSGDAGAGGRPLLRVGRHVVRGDRIAFFAEDDTGTSLQVLGDGTVSRLVGSGDAARPDETVRLREPVIDGTGRPVTDTFDLVEDGVVFSADLEAPATGTGEEVTPVSALLRVIGPGAPVDVLRRAGQRGRATGELRAFLAVATTGDDVVFTATPNSGGSSVLRLRGRRLETLARRGDRAPGFAHARLDAVRTVAASGDRVLLAASVRRRSDSALVDGLFLTNGGRIGRVAVRGQRLPDGATLGNLVLSSSFSAPALDATSAVFVAPLVGESSAEALVELLPGSTPRIPFLGAIARAGDAVPGGGAVRFFGRPEASAATTSLVLDDPATLVPVALRGAGAAAALLAIVPDR